ncbi:MAG: formyltransferase [Betaproteobacteria bacterium RIFCSPLOWO2_02_FULL_65_24]|nr:MAG: formyltransferase [Betaproteobacteria bacterium RIFCSPLOWO2_02_FULL_65_24]
MTDTRCRAVVFAYHDVGVRCLGVLLEAGVEVSLVVTHRDDPGEQIWFASVAELAARHGIETLFPDDPNSSGMLTRIRGLQPEFIFSFYYRRMLCVELLAAAKRGAFNMHGSLLPKYRGRVPVNWAVLHGERETGATLHEMVEKPDAGRIVDQQVVPIGPDDQAVEVFRRVTDAAETVLRRSLPGLIDGSAVLKPQDLAQGSYFGGRRPEDGRVDWHQSAQSVHNLVRAVAPPYPGAFCDIAGVRVRILRTRLEPLRQARAGGPGLYREDDRWFADCGDGKVLRLLELAAEGVALAAHAQGGEKILFASSP